MILPLRRAHRSAFVALAVFLPALLASAWRVRRAVPTQDLAPELLPGNGWEYADGLVYWTAAEVDGAVAPGLRDDELPADAEFVGTVRSGAGERPRPPGKRSLVYSLAHGRVVGWEYIP